MKAKIIHIDNSTCVTGAYKALFSWCLSHPQFSHVWVLPQGSAVADEVRKRFTVYTIPFVEIGRSPKKLVAYMPMLWCNGRRLKKILNIEQPELIHLNDLYNLTVYAARAFTRFKQPVLVHARMLRRSFPGRIYDFWVRWHLRRADRIIAVSEAIKHDWRADPRVEVVYDPIEVQERLAPYEFQKEADEPFRFLYLANYIHGKGQDDALQAICMLRQSGHENFTVDFFGGDMGLEKNKLYRNQLEQTIAAQGLGKFVQLHGPATEIERLMKRCHALLHFSRAESFGMVCYEALYYGLPVISSDCGGPAEMMQPDISGILLPTGDIHAYAASMQQLMEHPERCRLLSEQARQFVRSKFRNSTEQLSAIFAGLIGQYEPA